MSGLTVPEIARALLVSEASVGQRITRAKQKIRHANIPLRVPPPELLGERTPHVLSCIYSVFTEGYWSTAGPSAIRDELCDEGVRLAGELRVLMPAELEAHALHALVLLHDSRRITRVDAVRSNLVPTVRADLLRRAGRYEEAVPWYRKAMELNGSEPGRAFLRRRISECGG